MAVQALSGLLLSGHYRDSEFIRTTWFGNDWVSLLVAVPLLLTGLRGAASGGTRGLLLWLGLLAYAVYNYLFYLFGAALNVFFLLYVVLVLLAVVSLLLALSQVDAAAVARRFGAATPVRTVGGALVGIGGGLAAVWIGMWAAYVFAGRPTPIDPEAFKIVAALDLALMVPALTAGGVLLWRRRPWGYVLAPVASLQGALYLVVLSVNSVVAIRRGLAEPPGELPIWGSLGMVVTVVALVLLAHVQHVPAQSRASGDARNSPLE
jgi:hypothetical protein